ncbi:hypothetical protein K450DRAFT_226297 [Umbelopsis ramanniana AG]|uniref:Uncharacterized protein n=1 Tax=Umbelopsis ramanniana AG TaxID=1314678 RepID=A0AAD5HHF3_UMBRA|nr:uncharacterized protein K450DRAFT_226297 [Umbelopsis ramanniana AG]KAI8582646.1 hypothetical protein K450DRAFT_226297 [Umbelopsis ramanniana AG]
MHNHRSWITVRVPILLALSLWILTLGYTVGLAYQTDICMSKCSKWLWRALTTFCVKLKHFRRLCRIAVSCFIYKAFDAVNLLFSLITLTFMFDLLSKEPHIETIPHTKR